MDALRRQIVEEMRAHHPQSVRHCFYRMTDPRLPEAVPKSESGYVVVQRQLVHLRRQGIVPYGWITDATRRGYFTTTYAGPADALDRTAELYRRDYWSTAPWHVEVWVESRSIAGVIEGLCRQLGVPLYPSGGFTSLSFSYDAAQAIAADAHGRPVHVLYIGDYDGAGILIDKKIEQEYRLHLRGLEITFHRIGVTREQIDLMGLPTKPPKKGDRSRGFHDRTVEAETIPVDMLRAMLRGAVERFMDSGALKVIRAAEESERDTLRMFAAYLRRDRP